MLLKSVVAQISIKNVLYLHTYINVCVYLKLRMNYFSFFLKSVLYLYLPTAVVVWVNMKKGVELMEKASNILFFRGEKVNKIHATNTDDLIV